MATTIKLDLNDVKKIVADHGLAPGGDVQKFFSNELLRISDPYTPFRSGITADTAYISPDGTAINYVTPYARYIWYGKLMVDPITKKGAFHNSVYGFWSRPKVQKELTDTNLKYQGAPLRGPKWVERAYIDNKDAVIASVERFANRR